MRGRRGAVTTAALALAALGLSSGAAAGPVSPAVAAAASASPATAAERPSSAFVAAARTSADRPTALEARTGLSITITTISPLSLTPGEPLRLTGTAVNTGDEDWSDANVYLSINADPARSKTALESFAATKHGFGNTINTIGLFDEAGDIPPGTRIPWHLRIPFARLPLNGAGVYQVGATLLATNADGRDRIADARAGTTIAYVPASDSLLKPTGVVTLVPVTAPILRRYNGVFVSDALADLLARGGRLRNLLDFAAAAPTGSVQLVVDPALRQAVTEMSDGYRVQTLSQAAQGDPGVAGRGQHAAAAWLAELDAVSSPEQTALLPWDNPATTSLADAGMPGVVDAAVVASQRYALSKSLNQSVVDWQDNGSTTRRGLAISRLAGVAVHIVSEDSLPRLSHAAPDAYPPTRMTINTRRGPVIAVVARSDVGGVRFSAGLTALQFRQAMLADTTVRSLRGDHHPTSVFAAPFNWDPGPVTTSVGLAAAYSFRTVEAQSLADIAQRLAPSYPGKVTPSSQQPLLPTHVLDAARRLRDNGRIYTDLLTDRGQASITFGQQLASAGSSTWRWKPQHGVGLIRELSRNLASQVANVTVTGPPFVAMSSSSGKFPLTVTNGMDVAVTVKVFVNPLNKALQIEPIAALTLQPGASRDLKVVGIVNGSGLTQVRARLATITDRRFGHPFNFNVRATQIGVAIWIALGLGLAFLVLSAARRIYRRARGQGFKTRAESEG